MRNRDGPRGGGPRIGGCGAGARVAGGGSASTKEANDTSDGAGGTTTGGATGASSALVSNGEQQSSSSSCSEVSARAAGPWHGIGSGLEAFSREPWFGQSPQATSPMDAQRCTTWAIAGPGNSRTRASSARTDEARRACDNLSQCRASRSEGKARVEHHQVDPELFVFKEVTDVA